MKPDLDLTSPLIQNIFFEINKQSISALDAKQTVESAVLPVYALLKRKDHQKPKTKLEQIGSGVLIKIKSTYFLFSATHVFFEFDNVALYTGLGKGIEIIGLPGERFSTGKLDSPNANSLDASVYHIQAELPQYLKDVAITMEDVDLSEEIDSSSVFTAVGFRIKSRIPAVILLKPKEKLFLVVNFKKTSIKNFQ
ncbi:hypothetical protein EZ456_22635 [Pedobacter psychrodurus]|uniref:Serine protease n=1 Tax=Pedobacter psychrodurus TaxID=2530456 RepID=A0A4R0PH71_9SPHI|nr:hypothetical protein [Pedobacter psychrodurus]TCD17617.1 hypothetical protein EZ456_22635 [Pedobacter psychrodurus]